MVGRQLSHYRILEQIGEGGMGQVYLAEDTKLQRNVALKVLPEDLADDPERRNRFEREARAVAALNHPNIITIYSVEQDDGVHFLTMELLAGRTLTELIPAGGMRLGQLLPLAIQMADALGAAHQQGITHRDLKPDNVMVDDERRLKVLDFGLAKFDAAFGASGQATALATASITQEGMILGTVAYMSPEQAEGRPADARSDVFSLGVILYQMITGKQPFEGDTAISTLSAILRDTPDSITDLRPTLPRHLSRILRRCLIKDPTRRYQSAVELRNELEELKAEIDTGGVPQAPAAEPAGGASRHGWRPLLLVAVGTAAAVSLVWALLVRPAPSPTESPPRTLEVSQLTYESGLEQHPSLSPDGKLVAYAGPGDDIYLLRVGGAKPINLTATSRSLDRQPAFSPDGELIAFRSERDGGGIFIMGATGESVRRLTDFGYNPAWSPDGSRIALGTHDGSAWDSRYGQSELWVVNVADGAAERLYAGDAVRPSWSPDGRWIAFWWMEGGRRDIGAVPSAGGEAVRLTDEPTVEWHPMWAPGGGKLYFLSNRAGTMNLWVAPMDPDTGAMAAAPAPVTLPVANVGGFALDRTGRRLVYVAENSTGNIEMWPFDTVAETLGPRVAVTRGSNHVGGVTPSPDGEWLAFTSTQPQEDVFVIRADGSDRTQLTDDPAKDRIPAWAPDGSRIGFYSNRSGKYELWSIRSDGSNLQQITSQPGSLAYCVWSPDSRKVAAWEVGGPSRVFTLGDDGAAIAFEDLPMPGDDLSFVAFSWSGDGRRLAGHLRRPDGSAAGIAVYSFGDRTFARITESGLFPQWLKDGRRLLLGEGQRILLVDTASRAVKELASAAPDTFGGQVRLSADGRRVYLTRMANDRNLWLLAMG